MEKRRVQSSHDYDQTPTTLLMALFGGACAFITVESIFPDVMESLGHQTNKLPGWQIHMGSACVGIISFLTFLFILEAHETRSKKTGVAMQRAVVTSRWAYGDSYSDSHPFLPCSPNRLYLWRLRLPQDKQRASVGHVM